MKYSKSQINGAARDYSSIDCLTNNGIYQAFVCDFECLSFKMLSVTRAHCVNNVICHWIASEWSWSDVSRSNSSKQQQQQLCWLLTSLTITLNSYIHVSKWWTTMDSVCQVIRVEMVASPISLDSRVHFVYCLSAHRMITFQWGPSGHVHAVSL